MLRAHSERNKAWLISKKGIQYETGLNTFSFRIFVVRDCKGRLRLEQCGE